MRRGGTAAPRRMTGESMSSLSKRRQKKVTDDITPKSGNQFAVGEGGRVDTKLDRDRGQDGRGHGSSAQATNHVRMQHPHCRPSLPENKPQIY